MVCVVTATGGVSGCVSACVEAAPSVRAARAETVDGGEGEPGATAYGGRAESRGFDRGRGRGRGHARVHDRILTRPSEGGGRRGGIAIVDATATVSVAATATVTVAATVTATVTVIVTATVDAMPGGGASGPSLVVVSRPANVEVRPGRRPGRVEHSSKSGREE